MTIRPAQVTAVAEVPPAVGAAHETQRHQDRATRRVATTSAPAAAAPRRPAPARCASPPSRAAASTPGRSASWTWVAIGGTRRVNGGNKRGGLAATASRWRSLAGRPAGARWLGPPPCQAPRHVPACARRDDGVQRCGGRSSVVSSSGTCGVGTSAGIASADCCTCSLRTISCISGAAMQRHVQRDARADAAREVVHECHERQRRPAGGVEGLGPRVSSSRRPAGRSPHRHGAGGTDRRGACRPSRDARAGTRCGRRAGRGCSGP